MTDKAKASEHDLREGSKPSCPKCKEIEALIGELKDKATGLADDSGFSVTYDVPAGIVHKLLGWRDGASGYKSNADNGSQLAAILEENQRLAKELVAAEQRILDHCCGKSPICCGDAHQELEWNLRVMVDAGLEREETQGKTFKEIVWRNKRAEAAEAKLGKMRQALRKYGWHNSECFYLRHNESHGPCNCGFEAALAE